MAVPTSKARGITARLNLMGYVDHITHEVQYCEVEGNTTGAKVVEFFNMVAKKSNPKCPTVLVLDRARIHTCKQVLLMQEQWKSQGLWLVYLPPYSPELNLMELAWRLLKYHKLHYRHQPHKEALRQALEAADWGECLGLVA